MKLAFIGYGNVGRALAKLLAARQAEFPFTITGIHTLRHGTAIDPRGVKDAAAFGPRAASVEEFLDAARADIAVELTTLNPVDGEPAVSHIRAAIARGMHVVTANKGPIAHAYGALRDEASRAGVAFRFESAVMDGAPVFNLWRHTMPGVRVLGFTGVLNSTSKVVIETMERGGSFEEGLAAARAMGITEADGAFDVEGWDSAAKCAALANVLMDAGVTPQQVSTRGITRLTPERLGEINEQGKTVRLISRGRRTPGGVSLRVRAEVLPRHDLLACTPGTSNLLLFHTDLMGTFGTMSIEPGVEQTAYGVFSDLVSCGTAGCAPQSPSESPPGRARRADPARG
ncbi:MAG TPA: homoserine dehydrogenase [Verrucomicrobiae bacterium]|nr:homoserine dehydrogenase [Verrucomicrobiae bacterium]